MSKEEWKESGAEMGRAWTSFGKTFVKSAKVTTDKVSDWADDKKADPNAQPTSNVYNDGSWRQTGKELGGAFAGMGKALLHTVGFGNDKEKAPENAEENVTEAVDKENADETKADDNSEA